MGMNLRAFILILLGVYGTAGIQLLANAATTPDVVHVGGIFAFDSDVGKVARVSIQAALDDVNSNPDVLPNTQLQISMLDSNYSGFLGIVETMQFLEADTVAIIGPQSSGIAHSISYLANELQVPLLSFAATDPTLTSLEYPFFVRTTQSDRFQMAAIAGIVDYYSWKEVIAVYTDDDYGRNGILSLGDELTKKRCKISYKAALSPELTRDGIVDVLAKVASSESRILVLHTYSSYGLQILDVARSLGMMKKGFVWIATNWLSDVLDTNSALSTANATYKSVQGLITLRMHTPDSRQKSDFVSRWSKLATNQKQYQGLLGLNPFGLYAYDSVWILARALDSYFAQGGNISFSKDTRLSQAEQGGNLQLNAMSIFDGGPKLLQNIMQINVTGLTGPVQFTSGRDLIRPAYEIINVVETGPKRIGYWSNYSGLSVKSPETFYSKPFNQSIAAPRLDRVIWPGKTTDKPRGWAFSNSGKPLRIGVPRRVSYGEIIGYSSKTGNFSGYSIDVFIAAVKRLPYSVPYKLIPFGDGRHNPSSTDLIEAMTKGDFDAAVGDISITTNRTRMADFTQPYFESGLLVVAPVEPAESKAWAFMKPFSPLMWAVTGAAFLFVGAVIWILEHRINDEFRGPPAVQFVTILWFSFSTLFFAHRETTNSPWGRLVILIWLFVVLILNSSYTASLTSMLTVQQLATPVSGIDSLMDSDDPIGYQQGSYARNYLIEEYNIPASRLVPLKSADDYTNALKKGPGNGGVAAIVDQRAYIELYLASRCEFTIVGDEFLKNGWGFAFPRGSPLAVDISGAILTMAENGELQSIHDKWIVKTPCNTPKKAPTVEIFDLSSFWGLYLVFGAACGFSLIVHLILIIRQFIKYHNGDAVGNRERSSMSSRLKSFLSFVDDKEEDILERSRNRQMEKESNGSSLSGGSPYLNHGTNVARNHDSSEYT